MLYMTCTNGYLEDLDCTERLPMISDVVCLSIYDRIFCILTMFYTLGVFQTNIRANYKLLFGLSSNSTNDLMYYLGMVGAFALPMVGYFDEHNYRVIHVCAAVAFFASICFYAFLIGGEMSKHKEKFPESQS